MAGTRKLEKFDLPGVEPRTTSGTRKLEAFDLDAIREAKASDEAGSSIEVPSRASDVELEATGDRPTPISLPSAKLVDATAAGPGAASFEISVPAPAIELETDAPRVEGEGILREREEPVKARAPAREVADPAAMRTRLARRFTTLADEVTECFEDFHIGAGNWGVELTAPEGMSTGGGKQAAQHLRMRPTRAGFPVLVAGTIHALEKTAELRDYAHVVAIHEARFDGPLEISEGEWEQLLRKAEVVFKLAGFTTSRVAKGKELEGSGARRVVRALRKREPLVIAGLLAILAVSAVLVVWLIGLLVR